HTGDAVNVSTGDIGKPQVAIRQQVEDIHAGNAVELARADIRIASGTAADGAVTAVDAVVDVADRLTDLDAVSARQAALALRGDIKIDLHRVEGAAGQPFERVVAIQAGAARCDLN